MKKHIFIHTAAIAAISMLVGCSNTTNPAPVATDDLGTTGLALTTDILDDTDVAQMHYTITGVDCGTGQALEPAFVQEVTKDLEDLLLPGGNDDLAERPFDAASGHLFADAFFWLPEGCYDVNVQPINADGEPSADCASASQDAVPVFDGQTTEILLINQCENDPFGGLDVIAALNHAPQITGVVYSPSKFTCEDTTTICVTASDADSDPLSIDWQALTEGASIDAISEEVDEEGNLTSCATINLAGPGDYQVSYTVFDLAYDDDGNLVPIEQLLAAQGDDTLTSNDAITLPIHAMSEDACVGECACPDGFELNPTGDVCERITTTDATFNGELLSICEGSKNENYGALGALFPDGTTVKNDFFGDGYTLTNGSRLLNVGIWACDANGNQTENPTNEWIGFSSCLNAEEAGAYVVGIAADNFIRARLNGQEIFYIDDVNGSEANHPYKHWHMIPVTLTAGANIIELEALNVGGPAAFAAQIYGPFATDDVADDASMVALDYENNIFWSTGDQFGGTFTTGTNSGYSCEDGYALDLCGETPSCTQFEREACE